MTSNRRGTRRAWAVAVLSVAVVVTAGGCGAGATASPTTPVARGTGPPPVVMPTVATPPPTTPLPPAAPQPATTTAPPAAPGAAPPAGTALAAAPHNNKAVLVVGDSLAEGTMYYLPGILRGHPLTSRYHIGYALRTALPWLEAIGPSLAPIVVVNLGNNDAPVPSILGPEIRKTLDVLGNRCVIWPTIVARGSYNGYPWANFNKVLLAETANRPNVNVLDWVSVVAGHPEWLASDGIHVSGVGYQTRAHLVAAAIDQCP